MTKHQSPDSTGLDVIEIGIRAAKGLAAGSVGIAYREPTR